MMVLFYVSLGLLGLYLVLRLKKRNGKPLPGPKGWPLVGLGFELTPQNMFSKFSQYAQRYGDVFGIKIFGNGIVVLSSSELIRKAFSTEPYKKFMNDRGKTFYGEKILCGSQSIAFMEHAFGSKHSDLRKGFTRVMHVYGEGRKEFEDLVQSELSRLTDKIESYGGKEFDFQDLIKNSLGNIISIILSGDDLKTEEHIKVVWEFYRSAGFFLNQKVDAMMRMFPFIKQIPSIYRDRYKEIVNAKNALTKMFYEDAKATYTAGVIRGIVDAMIKEQLQSQKNGEEALFSDERLIATILETVAAGVASTNAHLSSMILCLMNNPKYQVKIQGEVDRVIGKNRLPTLADKARCPMIEAVTLETHRHLPVAPGLIAHECKSNIEFEGYDIPRNSAIIANVFHVHHDENIWGDPWNFRPERFLGDNGDLLPNDHLIRKSWLPFGTGRRQCAAESLARSRVFLLVATLLQRWTFELPPGSHVSCDPRSMDFNWDLNLCPKPFYCCVVPRESMRGKLSKEAQPTHVQESN